MRSVVFVLFCAVFSGVFSVVYAAGKFSVDDMLAMERISEPVVSPDGEMIVFIIRKTDLEANRGRTDLWLVKADGSGLRQLTSHPENDSCPWWSADGQSILFLSDRSGSSQVWQIRIDGGEAQQVTEEVLDVSNLAVSGNGEYIAFTMEVFPGYSPEQTKEKLDEQAKDKVTGRVYDKLFVRHWDTWKDGRRSHLFVRAVEGGESIDVMKKMDADTPSKPFGGVEEITFTPDGTGVVFSAKDVGSKEAWSTDFDLYYAPIDGSREPGCMTDKNEGWDTSPVFSPDGKTLAYLSMARAGFESDRYRIILRDWSNGKERVLTEKWDRSPGGVCWSPDSKKIYVSAANIGQRSLFAIDADSGSVETIVKEGNVEGFSTGGESVVYAVSTLKSPVELYLVNQSGRGSKKITGVNDVRLSAIRMGDYEQFSFKGWNDENVYCYIVKPADFDERRQYPVAFLIHGGPQGSFGNSFHYRWNPQAYAGAGYAVVMVDFHGSIGYGQDFTDSIRGDWGGKPLEDLQKGLSAALERYPWMDGEHVSALGASFGGYMINWIAGNWSDRFCCLVNHDGNIDERMAYFDTEELWFPEWEHRGRPWDNPEAYEEHNPVNYVKNWKTPMLVIHGGKDFRVVETQGLATFTALQRQGVASKLLYFPDENHWVLKPANSVLWHKTVIGWLDEWTK